MRTVHEGGETPQMTERQKEIIRIALRIMAGDLASIMAEFDVGFTAIKEEEISGIIDLLN